MTSPAPISIIVSLLVKRAETAVIVVPTVIFLGLLPGLLYYDLVSSSPSSILRFGPSFELGLRCATCTSC
jgi:hypothetical protein